MKIAFFGVKQWEGEYIKEKAARENIEADFSFTDGIINKDHMPEETDFDILSIFVNSAADKEVLEKLPNLKFIVTRSTGYEHVDGAYAKERGIPVANVPSYGENTVAEFAFALLLTLSRKIYHGYHQIRESGNFSVEDLQGFDLKGKTFGVVGTGRIGRHSIRMAKGFDMRVVAFDAFPNEKLAKEFDFEYMPLEDLLGQSDIVTLHVPYMKETHHLLNEETIPKMKKGAYLINTSRGGVVDTNALVKALKNGHLGGAGLDVMEEEGVVKDEMDFILKGHPSTQIIQKESWY